MERSLHSVELVETRASGLVVPTQEYHALSWLAEQRLHYSEINHNKPRRQREANPRLYAPDLAEVEFHQRAEKLVSAMTTIAAFQEQQLNYNMPMYRKLFNTATRLPNFVDQISEAYALLDIRGPKAPMLIHSWGKAMQEVAEARTGIGPATQFFYKETNTTDSVSQQKINQRNQHFVKITTKELMRQMSVNPDLARVSVHYLEKWRRDIAGSRELVEACKYPEIDNLLFTPTPHTPSETLLRTPKTMLVSEPIGHDYTAVDEAMLTIMDQLFLLPHVNHQQSVGKSQSPKAA